MKENTAIMENVSSRLEAIIKDLELQVDHLNGELVEKDLLIEKLTEALEAVDDHGRALSFVEILKEKKKIINELVDSLDLLKLLLGHYLSSAPSRPLEYTEIGVSAELIKRARGEAT